METEAPFPDLSLQYSQGCLDGPYTLRKTDLHMQIYVGGIWR